MHMKTDIQFVLNLNGTNYYRTLIYIGSLFTSVHLWDLAYTLIHVHGCFVVHISLTLVNIYLKVELLVD